MAIMLEAIAIYTYVSTQAAALPALWGHHEHRRADDAEGASRGGAAPRGWRGFPGGIGADDA